MPEDVKPILKRTSSLVAPGEKKRNAAGVGGQQRAGRMQWDEENLRENAEYMAANPKMKIDEPDTPFNPYCMDEDKELNEALAQEAGTAHAVEQVNTDARMLMLSSRLTAIAEEQEREEATGPAGPTEEPGAAPCTPPSKERQEQAEHEAEFKQKRKAVYADEGAKFRALLAAGMPDSDEDDDDDDGEAGA